MQLVEEERPGAPDAEPPAAGGSAPRPPAPIAPPVPGGAVGALRRGAVTTVVSLLTAVASTWPTVLHFDDALALGTEREATVPLLNLWQLWWMADRLPAGLSGYLDAPIFHPNAGVTAFTEAMPLVGVLMAPLWWLGVTPAAIANTALLLLLTLNGVAAYRLARALGVRTVPAVGAAVLAVNLPYAAKVLGVLPSVAFFGLLLTLEGLVRFGNEARVRWALLAGAGVLATFLTWQQYVVFAAPVVVAAGAYAARRHANARRATMVLAAVAAGYVLVLAAIAVPAARIHRDYGFTRSESLVEALSAEPRDFLTRPAPTAVPIPRPDEADTAGLFPGFVVVALAAAGAYAHARRRSRLRGWATLLVAGAAASVVLALGLNVSIGGWRPFATFRALDVVAEIRSPYRAAAVVQVLLVPLAALGLAAVHAASRRRGTLLVVLLVAASLVENTAPTTTAPLPGPTRTGWTSYLAAQPEGTVVAHIPFASGRTAASFETETYRMLAQTHHGKPLVNGYSGYFPTVKADDGTVVEAYLGFLDTMAAEFPDERLVCILARNLGTDLLVIDRSWSREHHSELEALGDLLRPAYGDDEVEILRIDVPDGKCRPQP